MSGPTYADPLCVHVDRRDTAITALSGGSLTTCTIHHSPQRPDRPVALEWRGVGELPGEELRRLDEDDTSAATARRRTRKKCR